MYILRDKGLTTDRQKNHQGLNIFSSDISSAEVAIKYCVDDIAGASIPGSRLSNILTDLELGRSISNIAQQEFLRSKGLLALLRYAKKECAFAEFLNIAELEKSERRLVTEPNALKEEAERAESEKSKRRLADESMQIRLRQIKQMKENNALFELAQKQAVGEKCAFDNDARNIAKAKQFKLRQKYGLSHFIEEDDFPKLMNILRRVDNGERLSEKDVVWLTTEGNDYFTTELREGFHKNEADFYAGKFKKSKDLWSAVNASSHYRKCRKAKTADSMLSKIDVSVLKNIKLKSAICTTYGGVKRDLQEWDAALCLGEQAHLLTPQDFRPCTLIGAVNMEIGQYDLGQSWYEKAIKRGYSERQMDDDLRSIFMRAEKAKKESLRDYLLKIDPVRYSWTKKRHGKKKA